MHAFGRSAQSVGLVAERDWEGGGIRGARLGVHFKQNKVSSSLVNVWCGHFVNKSMMSHESLVGENE